MQKFNSKKSSITALFVFLITIMIGSSIVIANEETEYLPPLDQEQVDRVNNQIPVDDPDFTATL